MEKLLLEMGFTRMKYGGLEKQYEGFYIEANADEKDGHYFWIYTKMSGEGEAVPYPYLSKEKFQALIDANIEYFK